MNWIPGLPAGIEAKRAKYDTVLRTGSLPAHQLPTWAQEVEEEVLQRAWWRLPRHPRSPGSRHTSLTGAQPRPGESPPPPQRCSPHPAVAGSALGLSKDLLQRAASVTLKERRPLVVCVRETPLNGTTLKHLVELDTQGAVVLPASPGFYAGDSTVRELVDFVAGRVLDAVGVPHQLYRCWEGRLGAAAAASSDAT
ncbi:flavoprotein [Kitasatospora sp. NBC_01560]|uniref:flavoprotein n=1 Tax=Kitasatospora sp. NBC_01560 TaxID=2975965 RepID=UPI00386BAEBB